MPIMTETQRNITVGVLIAGALAMVVYLLNVTERPVVDTNIATSTPIGTPNTVVGGVQGTGDYAVELVGTPTPTLGPIRIVSKDLSIEAQTILRQKIEAQYEILKSEPTRMDIWLRLGTNRKIGGDYAGAVEAWKYVAAAAPLSLVATARGNLADLYLYFLKDYQQAQTHYIAAIAANPEVIEYYRGLFYLYKDINKDPLSAGALIVKGLKANPNNPDLLQLQEQLKAGN